MCYFAILEMDFARTVRSRQRIWVKLRQAAGRTLAIEDIFIDLPVAHVFREARVAEGEFPGERFDASSTDSVENGDDNRAEPARILARIIQRSADKFDLHGNFHQSGTPKITNRILILDGPGQGKSTVGQFLAQLARARLLDACRASQTPETNRAIDLILARAIHLNIPLSGPPRFPFHVEMPRFADALNKAELQFEGLTMLSYLARQISAATESSVTPAILRSWLPRIPSVIILDGLDEISHGANRANVINSVQQLLDLLHEANCDSLLLVTSRPQGYQGELANEVWSYWQLAPLNKDDALELSRCLAQLLLSDEACREEVLSTMLSETADEATSTLMVSPLQVTLLFHLVSTHNNIPRDRWTLFNRHYETLRDREIAKGGYSGQIIRSYKTQIDRIHYDAGYLLQVRAETRGGSYAFFSIEEFSKLVSAQLEGDGYCDNLGTITQDIVRIATDRLVFLRCQIEGQVAFDVRSLQEFMAAARITTSPEGKIYERLYHIAGRSHWLHVVRIACSKIFASASNEALRDEIVRLVDSLDIGDRTIEDRIVKTGAVLASTLLGDGIAASTPAYRRRLLLRAVSILSTADELSYVNLITLIDRNVYLGISLILTEIFTTGSIGSRFSIVRLLIALANNGDSDVAQWASALLTDRWPSDPVTVLELFDEYMLQTAVPSVVDKLNWAQWSVTPEQYQEWLFSVENPGPDQFEVPERIRVCVGQWEKKSFLLIGSDGAPTELELSFESIGGAPRLKEVPSYANSQWRVVEAAIEFSASPSAAALAQFLTKVYDLNLLEEAKTVPLPWVLAAVVHSSTNRQAISDRAAKAAFGLYGDADVWRRAEERWVREGIKQHELPTRIENVNVTRDIDQTGGPPCQYLHRVAKRSTACLELLKILERDPESAWARGALLRVARRSTILNDVRVREYILQLPMTGALDERFFLPEVLADILARGNKTEQGEALEKIRLIALLDERSPVFSTPRVRNAVVKAFNENIGRRYLLPVIATNSMSFRPADEPLTNIHDSGFILFDDDSAKIVQSVWYLRILAGRIKYDDVPAAARSLVTGDAFLMSRVLTRSSTFNSPQISEYLGKETWLLLLANDFSVRSHSAYSGLRQLLAAQSTKLADQDCANSLSLPALQTLS